MMQKLRGILVVMAAIAALTIGPRPAQTAGIGIEVTPAKLEISVPSGATYNIPITVHNSSFDPVHVQASMVDFGVGQDGSYQFARPGSRANSLLKFAAIRPREFDLAPDTTQQVQLTVQIPQTPAMSGEYAGIVFFQTRPPRRPGAAVAFSVRVASKIYETIPGTVKIDGAITKMVAAASPRGELYRVIYRNTGNTHVYLRGQLTVQKGNAVVEQLELANGDLVERGGTRLMEVTGRKLEPGQYVAIATVDYGGKTQTGGEIAFEVH
jgi:hypothetical protein